MLTNTFNFSTDDRTFIEQMDIRFPSLIAAFNEAAAIPAQERYHWARKKLETLPRSGYVIRGILPEYVETVREHINSSKALAHNWTPDDKDKDLVLRMIEIHDIGEAVIGDFTPHDPITSEEKMRLERLAIDLIFEQGPQSLKEIWQTFEDKTCDEAFLAHDIEKAQCLFRALEYEIYDPSLENVFDDFWDNLETRWSSPLGPVLHQHTKTIRDRLRVLGAETRPLI